MYGFDPSEYGITPPSTSPDHRFKWVHGMWMPTFMVEQKLAFHTAQSISPYRPARSGQQGTGVYFAGNNLTMDSEEGALMSGLCIAQYAFGIDAKWTLFPSSAPVQDLETWLLAVAEFDVLYAMMFPPALPDATSTADALESLLGRLSAFRQWWPEPPTIRAARPRPVARRDRGRPVGQRVAGVQEERDR